MDFKVNISVCRICMKCETGKSLLNDAELKEKFTYTTRLKVKENDNMPDIVCIKCVARLKIAFEFLQLAHSTEKHLRTFLSKISNDFREVTKTTTIGSALENLEEDDDIQRLFDEATTEQANTEEKEIADKLSRSSSTSKEKISLVKESNTQAVFKVNKEESLDNEEKEVMILGDGEFDDEMDHKFDVRLINNNSKDDNDDDDQEIDYNDSEREINYVEEFHEIIQEDDCNSNQFIDENSTHFELFETSAEFLEPDTESVDQATTSSETGQDVNNKNTQPNKTQKKSQNRKHRSTTEATSNICIMCNRDFSTKTNLMRHMISHDGRKPYQCNICGKGFTQNGSLKQHMFIHTGEKPHVCCVCNRGFTQSKSLIFHMRRHTGEKPFNCSVCGIAFRQKDGLKHHFAKHHAEESTSLEKHMCCICNRTLSSKYSLQVHMKKHASENSLIESKPSTTNDSDSTSNVEKKPLIKGLPVPTKLYAGTGDISRAKRYQCAKCFKSYAIKRNLLRHLSNHDVNSSDLYSCDDCKIAFDSKRTLKLHRSREHKEAISDLNSCEFCDLPFVSISDLNEHIALVHDAIDQDCPHCPSLNFKSQKLFTEHMLEHEHMLDD